MEALDQSPKLVLEFEMVMEPFGKQRPRATKTGRVYTPAETVRAEDRIRYFLSQERQTRPARFEGPIHVEAEFIFEKPKSAPKKRLFHTGRPDYDNLVKLLTDSANGILWRDDAQIVSCRVVKKYGTPARVVFRVREAELADLEIA